VHTRLGSFLPPYVVLIVSKRKDYCNLTNERTVVWNKVIEIGWLIKIIRIERVVMNCKC
jgi:hypothetical protein